MVKEFLIITSAWVCLVFGGVALGHDPNLVGQWMFEQDAGQTVRDSSDHGFDGHLQGSVDWSLGMGQMIALSFEGDGYVLFDDPIPLPMTNALTITALIKPEDLSCRGGLLTHGTTGSPWALQLTPEGTLRFVVNWRLDEFEGGVWESRLVIQEREWVHVAITFDQSRVCFYVDGEQDIQSLDIPLILGDSNELMTMAADWPGSNDFFVGLIDYVRLYNRSLSASEIIDQLPVRTQAYHPDPEQEATSVLSPILSWWSADEAVTHRVWLGQDRNDLTLVAQLDSDTTQWWFAQGWVPGRDYTWRIDEVMAGGEVVEGVEWHFTALPLKASNPEPVDGMPNVLTSDTLSWEPGASCYWHQVYLGTDPNAVLLADEGWPQYMGTFDWDEYVLNVTGLESGQSYYWRVDEIEYNGVLRKGDLWQFSTLTDPDINDDSLLAWWPLDEGQGELVADHSGYGHHASVEQAQWTSGRSGSALIFDSEGTLLQTADNVFSDDQDSFSMSLWIYPITQENHILLAWGRHNGGARSLALEGTHLIYRYPGQAFECEVGLLLEQWSHIVLNVPSYGSCQIVLNGVDMGAGKHLDDVANSLLGQSGFYLGGWLDATLGRYFDGMIDEVRVYDHALDSDEIAALYDVDPYLPYDPIPEERSTEPIAQAGSLQWSAGIHPEGMDFDVFLGTDYYKVVAADTDCNEVYLGTTELLSMTYDPQILVTGQTYYWRVDQRVLDGDPVVGDVWRFTAVAGLVIDDFESYSMDNLIYETWHDGVGFEGVEGNGTGSLIGEEPPFVETEVAYSGTQSMAFTYRNRDNDYPYYSEATRTFATPQNWDIEGATVLKLYLTGNPSENIAKSSDMIYLRLADTHGIETQVVYEDTLEMIESLLWHQWDIELETLRQTGLDLQSIESLTLGIGQPEDPKRGDDGVFYVDDIEIGVP